MSYEVVVVGGGIGGLTVAALLARRGVNVCLYERGATVGGCVASFQKLGYTFEPTEGIYPLWGAGEIHARVFSELSIPAPEVELKDPAYAVRLPDGSDITIRKNTREFEENLARVFPECARQAIRFYRRTRPIARALLGALERVPDLRTAGRLRQLRTLSSQPLLAAKIFRSLNQTALQHLANTSPRFQRFIDVQLQALAQSPAGVCAYLYACVALEASRLGSYAIRGGAISLAEKLASSVQRSGGNLRLSTQVLRLAYNSRGRAIGVDLLSGERVEASRAVISNLTVWDTYGKLIGLERTPTEVRKHLNSVKGWGAYVMYLGMKEEAVQRLPAEQIMALTDWQTNLPYEPAEHQFMFSVAPVFDQRAPAGQRAVTVSAFTDVADWFTFHRDHSEHERMDQEMLEAWWRKLHKTLPELGGDIEVIETATPVTFYEGTRRKLGMVGGIGQSLEVSGLNSFSHHTTLPNVYMVGDTIFPGAGLSAVTYSAVSLAHLLTS